MKNLLLFKRKNLFVRGVMKKMQKRIIICISILLFLIPNISYGYEDLPDKVRVSLFSGSSAISEVKLRSDTGLIIGEVCGDSFSEMTRTSNGEVTIKKDAGSDLVQVAIGNEIFTLNASQDRYCRIKPDGDAVPAIITVNGKKYRGEIEIRRYTTSDMTVINVVQLEEYLYGVVPREIGATSPIEAIKAQAVIARNYAVNNLGKYAKWGFDVTSTTSDQAYGGFEWERETSNSGVDLTRGQLMIYDGKPAEAFYCASSGGKTEDVLNVWGSKGFPYLVSVDDPYDDPVKSSWEATLTSAQISASMKAQGYDVGDVIALKPLAFSEAGRVIKLLVKGTDGEMTFENSKCRSVLGKEILSQWYTVSNGGSNISVVDGTGTISTINASGIKAITSNGISSVLPENGTLFVKGMGSSQQYSVVSSEFKFIGKGKGHAIGMSQIGAMAMAKAGFSYEQILQHYFKNTYIE